MRALLDKLLTLGKVLLLVGATGGYLGLIGLATPYFEWYGLVGAVLCLLLFGWLGLRFLFGGQAMAFFATVLFTATVVGLILALHLERGVLTWWSLGIWFLATGLLVAGIAFLRGAVSRVAGLNAPLFCGMAIVVCAAVGAYLYPGFWRVWSDAGVAGFFEIAVYGLTGLALILAGTSLTRSGDRLPVISLVTLIACVLALALASRNQDVIQRLRLDTERMIQTEEARRAKIAAAEELKREHAEQMGEAGSSHSYILTDEERLDLEGKSAVDAEVVERKIREAREARAEQLASGEPAYRRRKAERRIPGKGGDGEGDPEASAEDARYRALGEEVEEEMEAKVMDFRSLTPSEKLIATALARTNHLSAKVLLAVAAVMVLVLFFQQLNRTNSAFQPLPLGGRWLDGLCPKEHVVWLDTIERRVVERFLRDAVRKGETFIHFAEEPLLPDGGLARWHLFGCDLPGGRHEHISDESEDFIPNSDFIFESSWSGRHSFTITGEDTALAFLRDLLAITERRRWSRAKVRHTLNLVWDLERPLPADLVEHLANQAAAENLRLVLVTDQEPEPAVDARIEAIYDDGDF